MRTMSTANGWGMWKHHVKIWADQIEPEAIEQIARLANLPFTYHHVAIMPDCHTGYGMPIGGVLATEKVVIPNAVGVDIGCGVCAIKTSLKTDQLDKETLKKIMSKIREVIPVGMNRHKIQIDKNLMPKYPDLAPKATQNFEIEYQYESARYQLGTLGGGNHFIEIQKDADDNVWIMIHSGSRNLGYKVAKYYNDLAVKLNERWFTQVPKEWQLAFLPIESQEAKDYMVEMQYCVDFALANRKLMMNKIFDIMLQVAYHTPAMHPIYCMNINNEVCNPNIGMINIAHNYARWENHFGKDVIVHRKGATLAREDTIGIIPGSQGTHSYIVKGLGNPESFMSCSHGAGRVMSRTKAQNELNLEDEVAKLDNQGIIHGLRTKKNLDEAPGAYKSIENVMEQQKDLVSILVQLTPIAVIKGD